MPYNHYHNWSFHTHHRRPKGGNHYNAIHRRQRPWRIGFLTATIALLMGLSIVASLRCDTQRDLAKAVVVQSIEGQSQRQKERQAKSNKDDAAKVSELALKVHTGINASRVSNGRRPLKWEPQLAAVSRAHSDDMADRGYFSHDTPEGLGPSERARRAGYRCQSISHGVGENIAIEIASRNLDRIAAKAVQSWMDSPGHRANLLDIRYNHTAVGVSFGRWKGYNAVYLTQVFC